MKAKKVVAVAASVMWGLAHTVWYLVRKYELVEYGSLKDWPVEVMWIAIPPLFLLWAVGVFDK